MSVHPPWLWESFQRDIGLSGLNSTMQRRKNKQIMRRIHAKSPYFSLFSLHPHSRQIFSCKAYSSNDCPPVILSRTIPLTLQTNPQLPQSFFTKRKLEMNESTITNLTAIWNLEENTDEWKHVPQQHEGLIRWDWGQIFQSAGLLASVALMPIAAHAKAFMILPTH